MKRSNSVGGSRTYPISPYMQECFQRASAILGQFNEGLDRLNSERQLTPAEQQLIENLDPRSALARQFAQLRQTSDRLWQRALNERNAINNQAINDVRMATELGEQMIVCANHWSTLKSQLMDIA